MPSWASQGHFSDRLVEGDRPPDGRARTGAAAGGAPGRGEGRGALDAALGALRVRRREARVALGRAEDHGARRPRQRAPPQGLAGGIPPRRRPRASDRASTRPSAGITGLPLRSTVRPCGAHPALADAVFLDVVAFDAVEADADLVLEHRGRVVRAARGSMERWSGSGGLFVVSLMGAILASQAQQRRRAGAVERAGVHAVLAAHRMAVDDQRHAVALQLLEQGGCCP